MKILGINAYHGDSSACLVVDGQLVVAIEEERIRRVKHWAGFPSEAIKFCLDYSGLEAKDLDLVAISRDPWARFHKKILRAIFKKLTPGFLKERLNNFKKIRSTKENLAETLGVKEKDIKAPIINVEHHRAHFASTFFVSPFDKAAIVSIDGFGDFLSTMIGKGKANKMEILDRVEFPHSLGIFYTALTQFLGFWNYGDEYKVMGLSAFGEPIYLEQIKKIILPQKNGLFRLDTSYFLHDSQGVEMTWLNDQPKIGRLFSDKLIELLGEPRKADEELSERFYNLAASIQLAYEEIFFSTLNYAYQKTKIENLALAGGCIQNSLANGKILERTPFKNIYIPPAAHDAGTAIGAAFYVWNEKLNKPRGFVMNSAYWGPDYNNEEIEKILKRQKIDFECFDGKGLIKEIAGLLYEGKIVGWFQGRTEWGPRALGNRSILANPCRKDMKDILNLKIKKRESFRPFAPSILEKAVSEYFERSEPVPFMEKVYVIKPEKREIIPAVTHVDGTGRLQSVNRETNHLYYDLIEEIERLTGVPIVLNTSFNENEPIVNKPEEAIDCYLRTKMDVLVLGSYLIKR